MYACSYIAERVPHLWISDCTACSALSLCVPSTCRHTLDVCNSVITASCTCIRICASVCMYVHLYEVQGSCLLPRVYPPPVYQTVTEPISYFMFELKMMQYSVIIVPLKAIVSLPRLTLIMYEHTHTTQTQTHHAHTTHAHRHTTHTCTHTQTHHAHTTHMYTHTHRHRRTQTPHIHAHRHHTHRHTHRHTTHTRRHTQTHHTHTPHAAHTQ